MLSMSGNLDLQCVAQERCPPAPVPALKLRLEYSLWPVDTTTIVCVQVDGKSFITGDILNSAPVITFLWVKRFPLGRLHLQGSTS